MSNILDPRVLASRPEYYLNDLNLDAGECIFLSLNKSAYRYSTFLDHRIKAELSETIRAPLALIQDAVASLETEAEPRSISYILHTAFCCSTLISNCLDIEGICCALREPVVLMQMANYKRLGGQYHFSGAEWRRLLDTVLFLLAKSGSVDEAALIKPTNAANNLAGDLLEHPRTGGVLLLYSSLERFLVSIAKKGEAGRIFVRRLFKVIQADSIRTASLGPEELIRLTDLQIASLVWYLQMDVYLQLIERFPRVDIRTLDCETFLAQPEETLAKLCDLFTIKAETGILRRIVVGPVFRKHSKYDKQDFDSAMRQIEYEQVMRQHGADIAEIVNWSDGIRPGGRLRLPLSHAL